jgi:hypothetical protein
VLSCSGVLSKRSRDYEGKASAVRDGAQELKMGRRTERKREKEHTDQKLGAVASYAALQHLISSLSQSRSSHRP